MNYEALNLCRIAWCQIAIILTKSKLNQREIKDGITRTEKYLKFLKMFFQDKTKV